MTSTSSDPRALRGMDRDEFDELLAMQIDSDKSRLAKSEVDRLRERAGIDVISDAATRAIFFAAMKRTVELRVAAVIANKHRDQHEYVAELVVSCVARETVVESALWATTLKSCYRRFSALCGCLGQAQWEWGSKRAW